MCVQSVSDAEGDFRRTVIMVAHSRIDDGSWQNGTPISSLALVSFIMLHKHGCIRKRSSAGRMVEWSAGRFRIVGGRVACCYETLACRLTLIEAEGLWQEACVRGLHGRYGGVHAQ